MQGCSKYCGSSYGSLSVPSLWHTTQCCPHDVGMWMVAYICSVQTADSWYACAYLFACVYCIVDADWQRPTIVPPMSCSHWSAAAASLVWNVIYLRHASPCAAKTKLFIELPTTLHYLLTTSSAHCLVAVSLMWLKTPSLRHPPRLYWCFVFFPLFLISVVSVRWVSHNSPLPLLSFWYVVLPESQEIHMCVCPMCVTCGGRVVNSVESIMN